MAYTSSLFRIVRGAVVAFVTSFILVLIVLRVEAYRFQHRAERLMEDFQGLKLHKSNWHDAETLMRRWGRYGHYQGTCDSAYCRYTVVLASPQTNLADW